MKERITGKFADAETQAAFRGIRISNMAGTDFSSFQERYCRLWRLLEKTRERLCEIGGYRSGSSGLTAFEKDQRELFSPEAMADFARRLSDPRLCPHGEIRDENGCLIPSEAEYVFGDGFWTRPETVSTDFGEIPSWRFRKFTIEGRPLAVVSVLSLRRLYLESCCQVREVPRQDIRDEAFDSLTDSQKERAIELYVKFQLDLGNARYSRERLRVLQKEFCRKWRLYFGRKLDRHEVNAVLCHIEQRFFMSWRNSRKRLISEMSFQKRELVLFGKCLLELKDSCALGKDCMLIPLDRLQEVLPVLFRTLEKVFGCAEKAVVEVWKASGRQLCRLKPDGRILFCKEDRKGGDGLVDARKAASIPEWQEIRTGSKTPEKPEECEKWKRQAECAYRGKSTTKDERNP